MSDDEGAGRWAEARSVRGPELVTDLLQITKSVAAATLAWWLSVDVLHSPLPFLAPWTALLTVHATVYRSLARGTQTTIASTIGVGLSFMVGNYLGVGVWTFALAIFIGLAGARLSWLGEEGVAIATTAIFVLGSGFSSQESLLLNRLIEVGVGVAVGIAANMLLVPPLRDRQAARYLDHINRRMGEVLVRMADDLSASTATRHAQSWLEEIESMDEALTSAWQSVRFARESRAGNVRHHAWAWRRSRTATRDGGGDPEVGYEEILQRVDEGISHLRHLARTIDEDSRSGIEWDEDFRQQWAAVARDTGEVIADPDAAVEPIHDRLGALAAKLSHGGLSRDRWPIYGSLITSVRHIVVIVDDIASARGAREASSPNPGG